MCLAAHAFEGQLLRFQGSLVSASLRQRLSLRDCKLLFAGNPELLGTAHAARTISC